MTDDQFALLQDKVALWGNASVSGSMELRDYNGRARHALADALCERAALLAALEAQAEAERLDAEWHELVAQADVEGWDQATGEGHLNGAWKPVKSAYERARTMRETALAEARK